MYTSLAFTGKYGSSGFCLLARQDLLNKKSICTTFAWTIVLKI